MDLVLAGMISILLGVVLVLNFAAGLLALDWPVGFYTLLFSAMMIVLALRVRRGRERPAMSA